jgi:hypothetical protein
MTPTATAARPKKKPTPSTPLPGGYTGRLLRVNLSTGKVWTDPRAKAAISVHTAKWLNDPQFPNN